MPSRSLKRGKVKKVAGNQGRGPTYQSDARNPNLPALTPRKPPALYAYLFLAAATILCLAPFSGRAFHVDDTLFVWTAQHILKQPLNPYSFDLVWDTDRDAMSDVTQNPPLASYYAAVVGKAAGWSERALHVGFMLPALIAVLGTYRLANRFTGSPLTAGFATLLAPGFLVSALSVMCDTMMLALWMLATIFWIEAEDDGKPAFFIVSGFLIGASALTKYFGAALIPLLLVYSLVRRRAKLKERARPYSLGILALALLIPVAMLVIYNIWTANLYGQGLLTRATEFAPSEREFLQVPYVTSGLVTASFAGACALPALLFSFLVWSRKQLLPLMAFAIGGAALILSGWVSPGLQVGGTAAMEFRHQHWLLIGIQLALFIGGGIGIVMLAINDAWKNGDAKSLLLMLWVTGTFFFAGFVNWTVNVRSILPLIPAVGVLLARRVDQLQWQTEKKVRAAAAVLVISGGISLWIGAADTKLGNTARQAATKFCQSLRGENGTMWFEGHWGFQYYMESCGARPVDLHQTPVHPGDLLVIPENNTSLIEVSQDEADFVNDVEIEMPFWATTVRAELGAGFYSAVWGPLPYVFGPVPPERYKVLRIRSR